MKRLLSVALLCAVGCSTVPVDKPVVGGDQKEHSWQSWIPGACADLWETFDARIGMDYGLGAHFKLTDLARLGIFDYSDFALVGVGSGIFHGQWAFPNLEAWKQNGSWDLSVKVGVGLGGEATLHTWEVVDFFTSVVGLGYWSADDD